MKLRTAEELADDFGIDVAELHRLRKRHHWPHVRLGRYEYRFTEEQVAEIVLSRSVAGDDARKAAADTGLTERSARRSA